MYQRGGSMKKFLLLICCLFSFSSSSEAITIVTDEPLRNSLSFSVSIGSPEYYSTYYCSSRFYGTSYYYRYCPYSAGLRVINYYHSPYKSHFHRPHHHKTDFRHRPHNHSKHLNKTLKHSGKPPKKH